MEFASSKQGTNAPSEFAELTKTILETIKTLLKIPPGDMCLGQFPVTLTVANFNYDTDTDVIQRPPRL